MPFLVLEGIDGSGKSTVLKSLVARLAALGRRVEALREPGSTLLGERIREALLDPRVGHLDAWTEACLFTACRAELVRTCIRPALAAGTDVLLDRYFYSTVAYQGFGGGADPAALAALNLQAVGGVVPDVVLLLDLEVDQALARLTRSHDRMEGKGREFLARVREGYREQARAEPGRWRVLDGRLPPDALAAKAWAAAAPVFSVA